MSEVEVDAGPFVRTSFAPSIPALSSLSVSAVDLGRFPDDDSVSLRLLAGGESVSASATSDVVDEEDE
jgi:hypothetical protein